MMRLNKTKFQELLLYVADKSKNDRNFGAVKLNKILFYSDFLAFGNWGEAITGATYCRRPQGPCPRALVAARDDLVSNGAAELRPVQVGPYTQKRLVPKRAANTNVFAARELELVDQVIGRLKSDTAKDVSERTHDLDAWNLAEPDEDIPYFTVLLGAGRVELSPEDVALGETVAGRINARA
jgi:hypothetical protein